MDRAIVNVINGELVPAASGESYDVIDPSTGKPVGANDPFFLEPGFSVWEERRHDWVEIVGDHVEHTH